MFFKFCYLEFHPTFCKHLKYCIQNKNPFILKDVTQFSGVLKPSEMRLALPASLKSMYVNVVDY